RDVITIVCSCGIRIRYILETSYIIQRISLFISVQAYAFVTISGSIFSYKKVASDISFFKFVIKSRICPEHSSKIDPVGLNWIVFGEGMGYIHIGLITAYKTFEPKNKLIVIFPLY